MRGPTMANARKKARITRPMAALRLRTSRDSHRSAPTRRVRRTINGAAGAGAPPPGPATSGAVSVGRDSAIRTSPYRVARSGGTHARVKARVQEIGDQAGHHDADGDDEQQGVDQ